jgi:hypothetical protein
VAGLRSTVLGWPAKVCGSVFFGRVISLSASSIVRTNFMRSLRSPNTLGPHFRIPLTGTTLIQALDSMTEIQKGALAVAIVAVLWVPTAATASTLVDTGTPTGTGGSLLLYGAQSLAAQFAVSAGETSLGTLSAYLTQGTAEPGNTFTFDIYQTLPTSSNRTPQPLFSTVATWKQNGWTTVTVDWTLPSTGDYWLVLTNPSSGRGAYQFDAPVLSSTSAGPVPALAFETAGASGFFSPSTIGFGVEVDSVPEPSSAVLALIGAVLMAPSRRQRT